MDEILQKAAEAMGLPPALTERSARARAEDEGTTVEAVLAEWAGVETTAPDAPADAEALETPNEGAESPPAATAAPEPQPAAAPAQEAPTEVTTDYLVSLAAEAKRMPEKLILSSATARARNSKTELDVVLATWAGVDLDDLRAKAKAGESLPVPEPDVPTVSEATPPPPPAAASQPAEPAPSAPAAAAPAAAAAAAMSADELLEKAAEAKGMPAAIAKRSAEARAKSEGTSLEAVLAEWAGIDPAAAAAPAAPAEQAAPAAAAPAAAAAAAMSADELLEKAAEAKGMPAAIAKRSAEARAKSEGTSLEAVLAEWAGVDPTTVTAGAAAAAEPAAAPAAQPAPATTEVAAEAPEAGIGDVEVIGPDDDEDIDSYDDEPVAASRGGYPAWLAAAFVIIPLLAVTYILVSPNGPDCGTAGQLNIDPVTGLAVNCDGSEYGGAAVDFFSVGAGIYNQCAACHGANGEGGGNFPAFSGGAILTTFPVGQCLDHVEWVALGTANFTEPTYGANNKPVGGSGALMPGYEGVLTAEEIAAVSLYERVAFGGQPLEEAELDCGLVVADGEAPAEDGAEEMTEASGG